MTGITVETIVGYINQLSTSERAKLYRILAKEAMRPAETNGAAARREKTESLPVPVPNPEPSRRWMAAHRSEYAGQWVALDGDRLIAAGATEAEVADAADADGAYLPLIGYIPNPDEPTFIGL